MEMMDMEEKLISSQKRNILERKHLQHYLTLRKHNINIHKTT
jgi:hypothetical protein